jgi:hypothetical protein
MSTRRPSIPDHDVEPGLLAGHLVVEEGSGQAEARVVNEEVDGTLGVRETRAHGIRRVAVGQVGDEHLHVDAVRCPQIRGETLEPRAVARDDDEVVALAGESLGEGVADPGRRTGDECRGHGRDCMPWPRAGREPSPERGTEKS